MIDTIEERTSAHYFTRIVMARSRVYYSTD